MNSRSSPALTILALAGWIWGKCRFIPGHEKVSLPGYRAGNKLIVIRIGRSTGNWDRIKEVAMAAEQIEQVIDLALRIAKLGRRRTSEYSSMISRERHGATNPWLMAMTSKASFPAGEIMADTRTFVSMTARITSVSRAGTRKSRR
jgi:hypothetical protein